MVGTIVSWFLFALGIAHVAYGAVRFRKELLDAVREGFVGKFAEPERRRTAFWFLILGPLLALLGGLAIRANSLHDLEVFKILGFSLLGISIVAVAAFPKSPLLLLLILAPLLLVVGFGILP